MDFTSSGWLRTKAYEPTVVASMGARVGKRMESAGSAARVARHALRVRLLGPPTVLRDGDPAPLPASRKLRALLAYLALSPRPVRRGTLCELLWDVPNDPRGELRWCLSKLRHALDEPDRPRVVTRDDAVSLDLSGCEVDALEVLDGTREGTAPLDPGASAALERRFSGEFLEGLDMSRSPAVAAWVAAERRRFHGIHVALLEHLARRTTGRDSLGHLERWLALAPFDVRAHAQLLAELARQGRTPEGDAHVHATALRFETEGLDAGPLRRSWRDARRGDAVDAPPGPAIACPADVPRTRADGSPRRASVAVLPFHEVGTHPAGGSWADGLVRDVITRLAKLRSLLVIAEGTALALKDRPAAAEAPGRALGVDYAVAGSLHLRGPRLAVEVRLEETRTARVLWAERFDARRREALDVLDAIGDRIVASVSSEIELHERNRAILKPPASLDAWECHHRALWHMYRFTRDDNEEAQRLFENALRLDPTFSRAHAGLSFTRWQKAFQGWAERGPEVAAALEAARQGMLADDQDPAVHWAQGRALWLCGSTVAAIGELSHAVDLSPNFAQGHYSLAFVQAQDGDPAAAIASADRSRELSPFDPLLFGMLGARAIALVRMGRLEEAADAATKAAARPNAHVHIHAIAAFALALAGLDAPAREQAGVARRLVPGYSFSDFLGSFRLDRDGRARFADGARRVGLH